MSNKVNAAARSFCFLLIRTKSTLGMQGIFDFYTLSYFKARDLWGESFTFFLGWHSPRQATLWPGLSLSWNKTFSTSSPPFHRAAASFHLWLTAPKPPVRQTLSPSLICQALQKQSPTSGPAIYPCGMYMWDRNSKGQTQLCLISQKATILPSFGAKDSLINHLSQGFISKVTCYSRRQVFLWIFKIHVFLNSQKWVDLYVFDACSGSVMEEKGFHPKLSTFAAFCVGFCFFFFFPATASLWFLLG